jgi:hypothetical protein
MQCNDLLQQYAADQPSDLRLLARALHQQPQQQYQKPLRRQRQQQQQQEGCVASSLV